MLLGFDVNNVFRFALLCGEAHEEMSDVRHYMKFT